MPLRIHCLCQSRSLLRRSSGPLSELFPTRILFRNLPPTSTLKSHLSPSLIMVPDNDSQLGTGTNAQGQRSWWQRLGEALRDPFLIHHRKGKLEEQILQKINSISTEENIAGKMNAKVEGKAEEIKNKLETELVEKLNKLEKDYEEAKNHLEGEVIKELEKRYTELKNKATALIYAIGFITVSGTILGAPIVNNILSLNVLQENIKILKEDVEDLRENQMQN